MKLTIHTALTEINKVRPTVTYNVQTKFQLNGIMHRLDAIKFTHAYTHTHIQTSITLKIA